MKRKLFTSILVFSLALAAVWLAQAGAAPTVTFEIDPPNPVAGQTIVLRDTSPLASSSWLWSFGDGASATNASPSHTWASSGSYTVQLTAQGTTTDQTVTVTPSTTLRMLAVHPFDVTISAQDPNHGDALSSGQAVSVTDRFGWFSFPGITNDPGNPEVTVKLLEASTFGHYWIFWSAMTSLKYTMTVTDVTTGQVQVYEKTDSAPSGGWDLTSFPWVAATTPGITPTAAPPTATPRPGTTLPPPPTITRTPSASATAVAAPTVTPTPTPSGPAQLGLRVESWEWSWCSAGAPCQPGNCAYAVGNPNPSGNGQNGITLHEGCTYQLTIYNTDPPGGDQTQPHELDSGLAAIGVPDTSLLPGQIATYTITIPTSGTADYGFSCKNNSCSDGGPPETTHEKMLGVVHVVP
jgi:PKD repeat protein